MSRIDGIKTNLACGISCDISIKSICDCGLDRKPHDWAHEG